MRKKVSIVIPAYNASAFIEKAINSVRTQTAEAEFQIIVSDDRSADNTLEIVRAMSETDPRIIAVPNQRAKGPSGARNTALDAANGDYIAFLDADDYWLPDHLQSALDFLEVNSKMIGVFFNSRIIELETGQVVGDWLSARRSPGRLGEEVLNGGFNLITGNLTLALLEESFIHLQSVVLRASVVEGVRFNETIRYSEDRDFMIRITSPYPAQLAYHLKETNVYLRRMGSLTAATAANALNTVKDHIRLYQSYSQGFGGDALLLAPISQRLYEANMDAAYLYRIEKRPLDALKALWRAARIKSNLRQVSEAMKIIASVAGLKKAA